MMANVKRIYKIIALIMTLAMTIGILSACNIKGDFKTFGVFQYEINEGKAEIYKNIVDTPDKAEVLVFPNRIEGKEVVLGVTNYPHHFMESKHSGYFGATKAMYVNGDVKMNENHPMFFLESIEKACVTILGLYGFDVTKTYKPKELVDDIDMNVANVGYKYNYDNGNYNNNKGYYFCDNMMDPEKDVIENIPPEPVREGYAFRGWYKEPVCINRYFFDGKPVPFEKDENGKIKEFTLYAKWV